jgi:hypothetical protein
MRTLAVLLAFSFQVTVNAYIWPSPQLDALESARFDQKGHNAGRIAGFIQPCDVFFLGGLDSTGRSNVGDWLRTVSSLLAVKLNGVLTGDKLVGIPRYGNAQRQRRHRGDECIRPFCGRAGARRGVLLFTHGWIRLIWTS